MTRRLCLLILAAAAAAAPCAAPAQSTGPGTATDATTAPQAEGRLGEEVDALVGELIAPSADARADARERLLELAGPTAKRAERVLELLPKAGETMPPALANQLNDLRVEIEKRVAESAISESQVALDVADAPLAKVLAAIELQTDNRLLDNREQFGQQAEARVITATFTGLPFWEAVDLVLDQAEMDVYAYSGDDSLALVNRDEGRGPRLGAASYAGPFRVEATSITATRSLRQPDQKSMNVELEVAWEPRLRPIALSQKLSEVIATNENGERLPLQQPGQSIDLELSFGNQATELRLPFQLPPRDTTTIATLRGTMEVLAPGREAEFRFEDLKAGRQAITKRNGGVTVTLAGVQKNGAVWEVHMRLRLDQPGEALRSHRGWVFDNKTFLLDENGEEIDHAGFETTLQTEEEIGLAYLFDHEPGVEGLTWVYRTPSSVHRFPVDYELKDLELP